MANGKVLSTVVDIAGSINPSLGKAVDSATAHLEKINVKAVAAGAAAASIAVALGKAAFETGKYLVDLGGKFDNVTDAIRIGTGAVGDDLDALMDDFDAIYKSVPAEMDDVATAVADFNTRLGLTGPTLQDVSKQALQVADMLGDDLGKVIEESSQAFQQWAIDGDDMAEKMDFIFKTSQSTGMGFSDLMMNMQKFGPQLQEIGYSFEEAAVLMGQMEKEGVNVEEALGALKKSVGALAKEGIGASEGVAMLFEQIQNAGTAAEATALANEVFGTRAGSTMATAIRNGTLSVADLTKELEANGESISGAAEDTYDFAERLQIFRQNAEVALRPLAETMFDAINRMMPPVMDALEAITPIIANVSDMLIPFITQLVDGLLPAFKDIVPKVVNLGGKLLKKLIPPIMKLVDAALPAAMALFDALLPILDTVIDLLGPILDIVIGLLSPIMDLVGSAIAPLVAVIGELINSALEPLMPIIRFLADLLVKNLSTAFESLKPIIETIKNHFQGLIDFITSVFTGDWEGAWEAVKNIFGNIWNGLVALVKTPINAIVGMINNVLSGIGGIKLPDWGILGEYAGKSIDLPLIPTFAKGGFTEGVSIAGEAAQEAIISFDPAYRQQNIGYWSEAGERLGLGEAMPTIGETRGSTNTIVYDFSGITFAPHFENISAEQKISLLDEFRNFQPELMDMLTDWVQRHEEERYLHEPVY